MPEYEDPNDGEPQGDAQGETQEKTVANELQKVMDQVVRAGHARAAEAQKAGGFLDVNTGK